MAVNLQVFIYKMYLVHPYRKTSSYATETELTTVQPLHVHVLCLLHSSVHVTNMIMSSSHSKYRII